MTPSMKPSRVLLLLVAVGALALLGLPTLSSRAQPDDEAQPGAQKDAAAGCQQMMQMRQEMMAQQKTLTKNLEELVSRMKDTKGDEQQAVMADLLEALVDGRGAMMQKRMAMRDAMMAHMQKHMKANGDTPCPMMQKMQRESMGGMGGMHGAHGGASGESGS